MSRPRPSLRLLSPWQRWLLSVVVILGVVILANSLYLFGYTLWQEGTASRARLLASYQWQLVGHFGVGLAFVALAIVFAVVHLPRAMKRKRGQAVLTGVLALAGLVALLATGLFLLRHANSDENRWAFHVHRVGGLAGLLAYLAHRWGSADPTPRWLRVRTTALTVGLALAMAAVHVIDLGNSPEPPAVYERAFQPLDISSDPFVPFQPLADVDPDSDFYPSAATLSSGGRLDPSVLMPGPLPDEARLAAEFAAKGFTSEQAIGAEDCRLCHQDTVAQWEASAHRFSSFNNPFYSASVMGLRDLGGTQASQFCGGCHDPAVMLAGDFQAEIDFDSKEAQAGLTCTVCHIVSRVHDVSGNGNYELADNGEDPYLFADAVEGWELELRKYLIKARPRDHKDFFLKPFYRSSEYCAACHKVSLDTPINDYKWLRGQDEYDNWHASGVSRNASRTFYLPEAARICRDCHMPMEPAPQGDLAAEGGMIRSHRFLAANTALPHVRGDTDTLERIEAFLQASKLRVDIFAMEHPRDGLVLDLGHARPELRPGDELTVYVVVRNLGVGHTFPGGTNDSNEGWLAFEAGTDADGPLVRSGTLDEQGELDPQAHRYQAVMLRADATVADERDAHTFHVAGLVRAIGPGSADVVRYRVNVPEHGPLVLDAALKWRKFNQFYNRFSHDFLGRPTPTLPVTTIASDRLELPVGAPGAGEGKPSHWERYNDLGIGLLAQGDPRGALAAFGAVATLAPARVDGYRNQARVHILQGAPGPARALLEACEERAPGDPQTKLWWAEYLLLQGEAEEAAGLYEQVLEAFPGDRATWRDLADLRFRLRDYEASLAAALAALRIDPEDAAAHYQRMLVYRAQGDTEREAAARVAFDKYRIDDNAPQIIQRWRAADPIANREVELLHAH